MCDNVDGAQVGRRGDEGVNITGPGVPRAHYARSAIFLFFAFTSSPLGGKILKYNGLRVKVKRKNVHTVSLCVLRIDEIG